MQIKLEYRYFRQCLFKQERVDSSKCTNICKKTQISKYIILDCKYYCNKQSLIKRTLKVKVLIIKILFLTQKDIVYALNYLKKTRVTTKN